MAPRPRSSKKTIYDDSTESAVGNALRLRRELSPPERKLWSRLRNRRLCGLKFRRQHPVGPYVADFYCDSARMVVEVDGRIHETRHASDAARDAWMQSHGFLVLRFTGSLVQNDIDAVLRTIVARAEKGKGR